MDDRSPIKLIGDRCKFEILNEPSHQANNVIHSICLSSKEDQIYVITNQGQMVYAALDSKQPEGLSLSIKFDYVQGMFHK